MRVKDSRSPRRWVDAGPRRADQPSLISLAGHVEWDDKRGWTLDPRGGGHGRHTQDIDDGLQRR